jgi:hypothetical protein
MGAEGVSGAGIWELGRPNGFLIARTEKIICFGLGIDCLGSANGYIVPNQESETIISVVPTRSTGE